MPGDAPGWTAPSNATTVAGGVRSSVPLPRSTPVAVCVNAPVTSSVPAATSSRFSLTSATPIVDADAPVLRNVPALMNDPAPVRLATPIAPWRSNVPLLMIVAPLITLVPPDAQAVAPSSTRVCVSSVRVDPAHVAVAPAARRSTPAPERLPFCHSHVPVTMTLSGPCTVPLAWTNRGTVTAVAGVEKVTVALVTRMLSVTVTVPLRTVVPAVTTSAGDVRLPLGCRVTAPPNNTAPAPPTVPPIVCVPAAKSSVAPAAAVNAPECAPPPVRFTRPASTASVPLLASATETPRVVAFVLRTRPLLLSVPPPAPAARLTNGAAPSHSNEPLFTIWAAFARKTSPPVQATVSPLTSDRPSSVRPTLPPQVAVAPGAMVVTPAPLCVPPLWAYVAPGPNTAALSIWRVLAVWISCAPAPVTSRARTVAFTS